MSYVPQKIALYCQNTFDHPNPTQEQIKIMDAAAAEIADSGFGTVLLGQWHVHPDGTIYYNDSLYTQSDFEWVFSNIPGLLKQNGKVQNVIITFGPFGSDFDNITNNLATFTPTIQNIFSLYDINGIDFDIEGSYSQQNLQTLVYLADLLNGPGKIVTAAPFQEQEVGWWQELLKATSSFAWWNLQMYGGADYGSWVESLSTIITDPQPFLTYGFKAVDISTDGVTTTLQSTLATYPGLNGGFIWRYEDIIGNAASYAQAIITGLQ